ncbi:MAG: hypothetical protein GY874_22335 [Desulfobacteraceae bacterium]|nr:hypothetical protein [Desulfobacteraceae bacterium]
MLKKLEAQTWVYVIIERTGQSDTIIGQQDDELNLSYIPAFVEKDAAMSAVGMLAGPEDRKFEIQAIIFEDLLQSAAQGHALIFILNGQGRILAKYCSDGTSI